MVQEPEARSSMLAAPGLTRARGRTWPLELRLRCNPPNRTLARRERRAGRGPLLRHFTCRATSSPTAAVEGNRPPFQPMPPPLRFIAGSARGKLENRPPMGFLERNRQNQGA